MNLLSLLEHLRMFLASEHNDLTKINMVPGSVEDSVLLGCVTSRT